MKEKLIGIVSILNILLLVSIVSAQSVTVNPSEFEVSLVGGENISKNFIVIWNGKTSVVGHIFYSVTEENGIYDGSELYLNFSENPIILEPNKPKNITATIHTTPNILPDVYNVIIEIKVELEKPEPETVTRTIYSSGGIKYVNITQEVPVYYENTTKIEKMNQTLAEMNQTIEKLEQKIKDLQPTIFDLVLRILGWLMIVVIIAVIVLVSLIKLKHLFKHSKEKELRK